jgi:hypothetical protein
MSKSGASDNTMIYKDIFNRTIVANATSPAFATRNHALAPTREGRKVVLPQRRKAAPSPRLNRPRHLAKESEGPANGHAGAIAEPGTRKTGEQAGDRPLLDSTVPMFQSNPLAP